MALFSSVLAYIFWNRGVEQVGADVAGLFVHLMPVFGVVLAWVFLDERLGAFPRRRHRADPGGHLASRAGTGRRGRRAGRDRLTELGPNDHRTAAMADVFSLDPSGDARVASS